MIEYQNFIIFLGIFAAGAGAGAWTMRQVMVDRVVHNLVRQGEYARNAMQEFRKVSERVIRACDVYARELPPPEAALLRSVRDFAARLVTDCEQRVGLTSLSRPQLEDLQPEDGREPVRNEET